MPVLNIECGMPWYRFEWQPDNRTLYVIRVSRNSNVVQHAVPVSDDIQSPREAKLAVRAFICGYKDKHRENRLYNGSGPQHRSMTLDPGKLGARIVRP